MVNNKSFLSSAAADVILLICLGKNIQNGVSERQDFKSHLFHYIIFDRFVAKEFCFLGFVFFRSLLLMIIVKNMGEGRVFQVVVSSLRPRTKQPFSHSDD